MTDTHNAVINGAGMKINNAVFLPHPFDNFVMRDYMSNFLCDKCGAVCQDSDDGYISGCNHYPIAIARDANAQREYNFGDHVFVEMPDGKKKGIIATVLKNYDWQGETKYTIHGAGFMTIASARVITPV